MRSTQSLRTLHSTSNAIRHSLDPSHRSHTLQSQSDMETVMRGYAMPADGPERKPEYGPALEPVAPMPPLPEILEPNVIIEQRGIIEPLPILGKVVYLFSR